ncbi:valine--tRNA ligase [candidate division Kazan bacterium RIFCSPHIGHO2_01_FULL_44_14]|uniref:Valine--tRNA ligase n=1 Tax=candidate division Kazan bacterium RIFCSPLOWO2_01_FULL_45_19 TaxID=1798538 RepID=A0A1F4NQQ9_UNCK3|nr:hypothetical protein [uncultured bacterium]AQS31038.1 hypothetical protein [uncultured bacterium]OGB73618.1 MAG: valine--tRNA ligase [candidate division Kazan bacterium RIFCSPLOWO2_01_FULL_45_19]OGB77863.1 MAG: valine--tRNA ligase [candidate division Kazan bacterium RIFCSPHIGHO2_01_FULL_44_14]
MDKTFDFKKLESGLYDSWEKSGVFTPKIETGKQPYTIIMPPPNANASLHIGHALFVTVEDIMVRYHRMKGEPTLWLPGADHAGIATQVSFEKELAKQDKTRFDLGRDEFVKQTFDFTVKNRITMENQLRALGASCDWTRKKFTLDSDVSEAVFTTFKKMYDEGLIYRGERIVNWCPRCATSLSDLEVEHKETEGVLTYIKYPVVGGGEIVVATTRPETMLGDTAVAVNPNDKRYVKLVGQKVLLPLMEREIPIITDIVVDMEFGTGAVKVTPAHDSTDFEIGQRHGLPTISVIGQDLKMTESAGRYAGMKTKEAREKVIADLQTVGLIEKTQPHLHSVGRCQRCDSVVEPIISKQWFVKIASLAKPAIEAVKRGAIKFIPQHFEKLYFNWMENIRDWNISRQLWWGHQIPVWYCQAQQVKSDKLKVISEGGDNFIVSAERPGKCPVCGKCEMCQDTDTLDTWFSSGLWPFTTLGWPKSTEDFKYFYPTTMMETGWDIIFFWVARMIMLGIYCTGKPPFELVYLNGLVRDQEGNKISKSKGNVIDPMMMVEKYGADALRMGLVVGTAAGNDTAMSEDKVRAYRNFANKIWNAARFINLEVSTPKAVKEVELTAEDTAWLKEFDEMIRETTKMMEQYQLGQAAEKLYGYFWHTFCDKHIEAAKPRLKDEQQKETAAAVLDHILKNSLIMLHPFVPFVTEAVWGELYDDQLITAAWPK